MSSFTSNSFTGTPTPNSSNSRNTIQPPVTARVKPPPGMGGKPIQSRQSRQSRQQFNTLRSAVRSPVKLSTRSPTRSPVRSSARSAVRSPIRSAVRSPTRSSARSPVRSPTRSAVRSPVRSPIGQQSSSLQSPINQQASSSRSPNRQQFPIGEYTSPSKQEWFDAIYNNDVSRVRDMIDRGFDPRIILTDTHGNKEQALSIAIKLGYNDIVKELLSIPRIIVNYPDLLTYDNFHGRTDYELFFFDPLVAMENSDEFLISSRLLFDAIDSNNNEAIKLLMDYPYLDINAPHIHHKLGYTPLQYSVKYKNDNNQFDLLLTDRVDWRNMDDTLKLAIIINNEYMVKRILEKDIDLGGAYGGASLIYAIEFDHPNMVEILLNRPDLNINSEGLGGSALHMAVYKNNEYYFRKLLEYGADVNITTSIWEITPLMLAAKNNNIHFIQILLNQGADVNAVDKYGNTALMHIIYKYKGDHPMYKPYYSTDYDWLYYIRIEDDILEVLNLNQIDAHNPINKVFYGDNKHRINNPTNEVILELLDRDEILLNDINKEGETALTMAAGYGDKIIVQMLLGTGKIEVWNAEKALKVALEEGKDETARLIQEG